MSRWVIEYWYEKIDKSPVYEWINDLEIEKFEAVARELAVLEIYGNQLKMPHSKALGAGLFELRERNYGIRIYYAYHGKLLIVLLGAGNKQNQDKDIKIARQRLAKLKKE